MQTKTVVVHNKQKSERPLPLDPKYKLYSHQIKALAFMKSRNSLVHHGIRGGILQMQMGMGKSLVALSCCLTSPRPSCREVFGKKGFPSLIIASKTVMREWEEEGISKFFGDRIKVFYLHRDYLTSKEYNNTSRRKIIQYDIVITTYDVVVNTAEVRESFLADVEKRNKKNSFGRGKVSSIEPKTRKQADKAAVVGPGIIFGTPWEFVFADESQIFANPRTRTYKAMMAVYGRHKWCLTGTPIRNYATDIWAQLRFCGYTGVDTPREWEISGKLQMEVHKLNESIFVMNYASAGIKLPKKKVHEIKIRLKGTEKKCYDYIKGKAVEMYEELLGRKVNYSNILAIFMRLRQCCIAPYLITHQAKRHKKGPRPRNLANLCRGELSVWMKKKKGTAGMRSAKMTAVLNILRKIPPQEKVLVFSAFTSALDLLADVCERELPRFKFLQLDGATKGEDRRRIVSKYRESPDIAGLLMTFKVGSEGLNLTESNHVICIEPWWNRAVHRQAEDRAWRLGQNKQVHVYNVLVEDSIEEKVMEICKQKEEMAQDYLKGSRGWHARIDKDTMGIILGVL